MQTTISIIIRSIDLRIDNSLKHKGSTYRESKFSNFLDVEVSPNPKYQSNWIFEFWIGYIKFDIPLLIE